MFYKKILASSVLALLAFQTTAFSEPEHGERRVEHNEFRRDGWHGQIEHFHTHDIERWRSGRWISGWHDGRRAYWWVVGGVWYAYPAAVYPYPDPLIPSIMIEQANTPNTPPSPSTQAPIPNQQQQFWYYCKNPTGYYPYVPECKDGWQQVPATPSSP